jgi:site-specific DNA recombinase
MDIGPLTGETEMLVRHLVPAGLKRRGAETRLILEGAGHGRASRPDPALIKAVARARRWFDELVSGRSRSFAELAKTEGCSERYVSRLIPLAFLAPEIVEAILAGTQPVDLTAEALTRRADPPLSWAEQEASLRFSP